MPEGRSRAFVPAHICTRAGSQARVLAPENPGHGGENGERHDPAKMLLRATRSQMQAHLSSSTLTCSSTYQSAQVAKDLASERPVGGGLSLRIKRRLLKLCCSRRSHPRSFRFKSERWAGPQQRSVGVHATLSSFLPCRINLQLEQAQCRLSTSRAKNLTRGGG